MGIVAGLLTMFGLGMADFLGAQSSRTIGSVLSVFWVQAIGFVFALFYFLLNFSSFNAEMVLDFIFVLIVIGFLQTIGYMSFYKGLKDGQVSLVSPLGASFVVVTVILSVIFFKETLRLNQVLAVILIICGTILVSINLEELRKIKKFIILKGTREGIVAMFAWGISLFLIVPAIRELGWFIPIFLFRFFVVLFLAAYIFFSKKSFGAGFGTSPWATLIPLGFLDIGAFFTYSFGVGGEYVSIVAPVAASFPLVTIIMASIFLKEKIVLNQAIGIFGIISG